jgi:phosphoribosylformimino-5-aminoimidazole carboxamide ribotide isomerase
MTCTVSRRSLFRPCIDLHEGQVKQIVGGTLSDHNPTTLKTNFVARLVQFPAIYQSTT